MSRLAVPKMVKHSRRISQEAVGGLDADLKARENAKRDGGLESDCCAFLTALTGMEVNDMMEDLKVSKKDLGRHKPITLLNNSGSGVPLSTIAAPTSCLVTPLPSHTPCFSIYVCLPPGPHPQDGVILCKAINVIQPKAVRKINKSKMPFKQMENISNFIKACRKIGVPEYALFTTPDLYDGKSVVNVTNGLVALGSKAQSMPGYSGPSLGASDKTEKVGSYTKGAKKSKWKIGSGGGGMSKMMMGSAGVMQKTQAGFHDISNGANYSGKSVGGRTKMGDGSSSVMDRTQNSYHDISKGANYSGKSVGGRTKLGDGSSSVMDRTQNSYHDISNGANYSGKSVGGRTKLGDGSSSVMDRTQNSYHDISNGAKYSGKSVGGVTKASQGSSQVMARTQNSYHDISNGAKHSGASVGGATLLSQGSSNTMERSSNQNFRDITRGAEKPAKPKPKPRPPPKPSRPKPFKTAAWDYVAAEGDELSMLAGDKITILEAVDDDWGKGKNQRTGEVGMYPMNYVE